MIEDIEIQTEIDKKAFTHPPPTVLLRQNKSCFHQIGRLGDGSSRGAARDKGGEEDVKKKEEEGEGEEEARGK